MTDLWQESTRDFEAERLAHRTASARIALADFIPYLTSAESTLDHENRVALIADRIEAAVHQAVGSDVGAFPVVHQAAMDALHADFQAVFTERQAEAQRVNAHRAWVRNQQRQATGDGSSPGHLAMPLISGDQTKCAVCKGGIVKGEGGWEHSDARKTALTDAEKAKVMTPGSKEITLGQAQALCDAGGPGDGSSLCYALWNDQIVSVKSSYDLDRFKDQAEFFWVGSGGGIWDNITQASKTAAGLPDVGGPSQTYLPWSWGQREQDMLATRIELAKARGAENLDPSLPYDLGYLSDIDKYEIFGQTTPENISHWLYQNNPDGLKIHQIGRRKTAATWESIPSDMGPGVSYIAEVDGLELLVQPGYDEPFEYVVTLLSGDPMGEKLISGTSQTADEAKANAEAVARNEFGVTATRKQAEYDRVRNPTYSTCSVCGGEIILFEADPDWWMHTRDGFNIDTEKDHQPVTASRKQATDTTLSAPFYWFHQAILDDLARDGVEANGIETIAFNTDSIAFDTQKWANDLKTLGLVVDAPTPEGRTGNFIKLTENGRKVSTPGGRDWSWHPGSPAYKGASKRTAGGDYVFLTTDGRTEFGNIYNFDDSVATERGRGSLDDMKLLWREYLSSHGGSNEHHSPDQTRAVGLLADKGYYSALYLGGTGGVYIRTADRSKVAKRTPNIFVQASVGWSATTDQMGAAVGYLSREWGDHGYRIKQDDRPGVFECSHSDGSRFYISADAYGNTADVPDSTTASRKQASAPEISADTMEQAVAKAQEIGNSFGGGSQLFIFSIGGERRVVEVADPVFGPRYKDMGSYEQFYGHPATASRRTALDSEGICEACANGNHGNCLGVGCMCIDMEHDEEADRVITDASGERICPSCYNSLPPGTTNRCPDCGLWFSASRRKTAFVTITQEYTGAPDQQYVVRRFGDQFLQGFATRSEAEEYAASIGERVGTPDAGTEGGWPFTGSRRTAGENPFAKKEPGAPTDAADTEGQPSETDPTASDDPAAMEAGTPVTISYTLTGEKTDAGDVEGTFDSFDGTTAFFTYEKGKFGVTNEGGKWVDSAGTVFTFAGGAPVEDPNAQQPPADGKTEVDTTKKPKPLASRHPFGRTAAFAEGDRVKVNDGDQTVYYIQRMWGVDNGWSRVRDLSGRNERQVYTEDLVAVPDSQASKTAAAGGDSIMGEKGRQADARTILQQIGTMTLMSLGQRNTVDLGDGVMFQVGAGNPLRKVIIKLNARDYYDVEIGKSQRSTFNWIVEFQQRDLEASQLSTVLRNALDQVVSASRHTAEANPFDGDSDANPYAVDERTPEPSNDGTPDDMLDGPAPVSPQTTKPRQRPSGAPANGSSNDQPMGVGQGAA